MKSIDLASPPEWLVDFGKSATAQLAARKAGERRPIEFQSLATLGHVCIVVVRHADREKSFEVSRDGGRGGHFFPPRAKVIVQPESTEDFLVLAIPKWLAKRIGKEKGIDLLGAKPPLSSHREWTRAQVDDWGLLWSISARLNSGIRNRGRRKSIMTRNDAA